MLPQQMLCLLHVGDAQQSYMHQQTVLTIQNLLF